MEEEVKYESMTQSASNPNVMDAVHSIALGEECDYRAMAKLKALVDGAFNEVCKGVANPKTTLRVLKGELKNILFKY